MISEGSCDKTGVMILNCNSILQYTVFFCIFDKINALVSIRDLKKSFGIGEYIHLMHLRAFQKNCALVKFENYICL